jgi:hypothetical protein
MDSVHGPWTTSGSHGPPWTGGSADRRVTGHDGMLTDVWPSVTPEHASSLMRAQKREGSAGNPSRASAGLGRRCGNPATSVKRRRQWRSVEAALNHGEGRRRVGRGAVEDGGGSTFYRGRRG